MLDLNLLREKPELIRQALIKRQMDASPIQLILDLDSKRRSLLSQSETLKARRNIVSKEISKCVNHAERQQKISDMRTVGDEIANLDRQISEVDGKLHLLVSSIPNIPDETTPLGKDESENIVIRSIGNIPEYDFEPQPHWEIGTKLGIINFDQGTKLSGSRFYTLKAAGARLQRALISWMLDLHIRQGYQEMYLPFMVKSDVLFAAGQLPKFAENLYHDIEEDYWMVPTAEVPLTGMYMGDVIEEAKLPLRYTAYTPCFRREKMSAGRDVRGIKRGHQFDKVEMYIYCRPEDSTAELERMLEDARQTAVGLGLTHRIKQLCTGDLGFNARVTYDLEVWAPGCNEWLEVSSVSNVGDFQARRANIKFRTSEGGKTHFVHTLNGSGLGLPRTLIAVLEHYQQKDGSIEIPEVLHPWMGGITKISTSEV